MAEYYLMHKDVKCGEIEYDPNSDRISGYRDFQTGKSPFMGHADLARIQKWWLMRAVPASRAALQDILRDTGCTNAGNYLAKNLALSMTDSYWICPGDTDFSYDDVKFANFAVFHDGKIPYHNATFYDPNASLGGQMDKYWDLSEETLVLVKESYRFFGQQSVNEAFASHIHELQRTEIPFVRYCVSVSEDLGLLCKCQAFTSETVEFIPAYEVIESQKGRNDTALYDGYIKICTSAGIDRGVMQDFMDYQTLTDFVISNTDEHLLNFGILRDSDTMQYIGPAPIFDSGNSMFYAGMKKKAYTRAELLERKITGFYKTEESLLKKIQNKNIVKLDLLPSPGEVKDFYMEYRIPEWKAEVISRNYALKLDFVKEFQQGRTISLYREKQKEKEQKYSHPEKDDSLA